MKTYLARIETKTGHGIILIPNEPGTTTDPHNTMQIFGTLDSASDLWVRDQTRGPQTDSERSLLNSLIASLGIDENDVTTRFQYVASYRNRKAAWRKSHSSPSSHAPTAQHA